jgi:hypothetical protein
VSRRWTTPAGSRRPIRSRPPWAWCLANRLGRGPAARADHPGRPSARAIAPGPGRGVDPGRAHPGTITPRECVGRLATRRGRFITVVALARRLAGILRPENAGSRSRA